MESTTHTIRSSADLGNALRDTRAGAGLTQQDVADRLGVDRSYYAKLEAGRDSRLLELVLEAVASLGLEITIAPDPRRRG